MILKTEEKKEENGEKREGKKKEDGYRKGGAIKIFRLCIEEAVSGQAYLFY